MKGFIFGIFFIAPIMIFGQNWSPFNPDKTPQFTSASGENSIYSIKIDSAVTEQGDTWYYLHPAYLKCDTCQLPPSNCESEGDSLYLKQSPLFGDSILYDGNSYSLYGPDLVVRPFLNTGDSYISVLNGQAETTASVTESLETDVLGQMDSVKTFSFDNGQEIRLSKKYGIVSLTQQNGNTETLLGIPELSLGDYFPAMRDFYDFDPGDVFMYAGGSYSSFSTYAWLHRIEITDVQLYTDSVSVLYNIASRLTHWPVDADPESSSAYSTNHHFTFSFLIPSVQGIIPGMMSYAIDSIQMFGFNTQSEEGPPFSAFYFGQAKYHNGRRALLLGGYTADFSDYSFTPEVGEVVIDYPAGYPVVPHSLHCDIDDGYTNQLSEDSLAIHFEEPISGCRTYVEYTEGLGTTCFYEDCGGLATNQTFMIGYRKGNEEFGNLIPLSEILSVDEQLENIGVKVFPNPANSKITLIIPGNFSEKFRIQLTDLAGRVVLDKQEVNSEEHINVQNLAHGIYMLRGQSSDYSFTKKVVIE